MDLKRYFISIRNVCIQYFTQKFFNFDIGLQNFFLLSSFQIEIKFPVGLH